MQQDTVKIPAEYKNLFGEVVSPPTTSKLYVVNPKRISGTILHELTEPLTAAYEKWGDELAEKIRQL